MAEQIANQILSQASENIQKLFELSTRIDERVKTIHERHHNLDDQIEDIAARQVEMLQKIAVLETHRTNELQRQRHLQDLEVAVTSMDRRLIVVEGDAGQHKDRWNRVATFVIQLVWVVLAAYMLTKFHLQAPAVP